MESLKAKVLIKIKKVKVYEILDNSKRQLFQADLKILQLVKEKLYLLTVGSFSFSLTKDLSVMRSTIEQYVFPGPNGFIGVIIPEDADFEKIEAFEAILTNETDFSTAHQRHMVHEVDRSMTFDLDAASRANEYQKTRKLSLLIESGSEHIKKGFMRAATFTSEGIKAGGDYLKSKLKKNEKPLEISEQQSEVISHLKKASNVVLMLSKALVVGAVSTTREIGNWATTQFSQSDASKKLERSHGYIMAKELGRAGLSAAITLYDGLEEALIILGKSGAETTVDVVDHKYGSRASEATEESLKVLGNVGLAMKEVHHVALKTVAKAAESPIKKK